MEAGYRAHRRGPARRLPAALELPLASGADHWYWLGGRPSLDFVNTRRERAERDVETLVTPQDLAGWLHAAGLLARGAHDADAKTLREAIALRDAIDAAVTAVVGEQPPPQAAVATIDGWLWATAPRAHLSLGADGAAHLGEHVGASPLRASLGAIALDAAELVGVAAERARLRICAGDACSARFYDGSRPRNRRWCSMRACGNAAKARRHRARAAATARTRDPA